MARSRFDELHDEYDRILTTKAGTRYERLAAMVLKHLVGDRTVLHDLRLVGDSDVKHQIDVTVADATGERRRVLIEAKDYDLSGDPVGLPIVRDFSAVVLDTQPDEAIIITCNGFTRDAAKFAKAKGIKLAVLREFRDDDWTGRIRTVRTSIVLRTIEAQNVVLNVEGEPSAKKLQVDCEAADLGMQNLRHGDPVFVASPEVGRVQYVAFLEKLLNDIKREEDGEFTKEYPLEGTTIEVENRGPIPLRKLSLTYRVGTAQQSMVVSTARKVAKLLLNGFEGRDFVIFDDQLRGLTITETGEVVER